MTLTTVPAIATGNVWTAAQWTDYLRTNLNDHKTFADGTVPFPGTTQRFANDSLFYVSKSGSDPLINFDSGDFLYYDRPINHFAFYAGSTKRFAIDSNGRIQTAAFESTEQTIAAGATANIAHGLGIRPRFFGALYGSTAGITNCTRLVIPTYNSLGAYARLSEVGATNLVVINGTAVTIYVYAFALV